MPSCILDEGGQELSDFLKNVQVYAGRPVVHVHIVLIHPGGNLVLHIQCGGEETGQGLGPLGIIVGCIFIHNFKVPAVLIYVNNFNALARARLLTGQ